MKKVCVVGGGAAGMFAAIWAARSGADVTILEKNEKLGKKIYITGKGRCNLTNACSAESLRAAIIGRSKFMYSAFAGWDADATMAFFENAGLRLVTERGGRVFPESMHASDVTRTLAEEMKRAGVEVRLNTTVLSIETCVDGETTRMSGLRVSGGNFGTGKSAAGDFIPADAVIIATGGLSYPTTGSTGDGYQFAKSCGHKVSPLAPGLTSVITRESWPGELAGLSLKNVGVRVTNGKKEIFSMPVAEMLFTHKGVSGPAILSASSYISAVLYKDGYPKANEAEITIHIDLKPALDSEKLDKRILREIEEKGRQNLSNALRAMFPKSLLPIILRLADLDPDAKADQMTSAERRRLLETMKDLHVRVASLGGFDEAIITRGGVTTGKINPKTMESKVVGGLYFAGEVLDVDALTGGYNLQIAWATGYAAGCAAGSDS